MAERSFEALYRRRKVSLRAPRQEARHQVRALETATGHPWRNGHPTALATSARSVPVSPAPENLDLGHLDLGHLDAGHVETSTPALGQWGTHSDDLARTIEGEVIPRLMLALSNLQNSGATRTLPSVVPTAEHVTELVGHALSSEDGACLRYVERAHARGTALDAIYLQLVAPAARRLGELWVDDTVDFTAVTAGLGRLHAVVRHLSPSFRMGVDDHGLATRGRGMLRRALLAPVAGEQHTLGCVMIEDYFSRAGWDVLGWPLAADRELVDLVRHDYYELVGLSVSCENRLPVLEQQIAAVRRASRNRSLLILVGGRVFSQNPHFAHAAGADLTADCGPDAVAAADAALDQRVAQT